MSFTDTRVLLATVLDSVGGLVGHSFQPAIIKAGSAWPRLESFDRGPGDSFAGVWSVVVALGGDPQAAANLTDDVIPGLLDEIEATDTAHVQGGIITDLTIGGTRTAAAVITVTSE